MKLSYYLPILVCFIVANSFPLQSLKSFFASKKQQIIQKYPNAERPVQLNSSIYKSGSNVYFNQMNQFDTGQIIKDTIVNKLKNKNIDLDSPLMKKILTSSLSQLKLKDPQIIKVQQRELVDNGVKLQIYLNDQSKDYKIYGVYQQKKQLLRQIQIKQIKPQNNQEGDLDIKKIIPEQRKAAMKKYIQQSIRKMSVKQYMQSVPQQIMAQLRKDRQNRQKLGNSGDYWKNKDLKPKQLYSGQINDLYDGKQVPKQVFIPSKNKKKYFNAQVIEMNNIVYQKPIPLDPKNTKFVKPTKEINIKDK